jgi:xanthine dehydrogenase accessory factor
VPLYFNLSDVLVLIRGGGDLATGVAHRLHRAGFTVMIAEFPRPLAVRRAVSFAEVVYAERVTVEGVTARPHWLITNPSGRSSTAWCAVCCTTGCA